VGYLRASSQVPVEGDSAGLARGRVYHNRAYRYCRVGWSRRGYRANSYSGVEWNVCCVEHADAFYETIR
jgi:hypothetical protein